MKSQTKLGVFIFLLTITFLMAGCKSEEPPAASTSTADTEEPEATAATEPEPQAPVIRRAASETDLALIQAAQEDMEPGRVKALLDQGAEVNIRDDEGKTPLHHAAFSGSRAIAELIIAKGPEINIKDANNMTPLHIAAWRSMVEVTELLLENGADVNAVDDTGETALHMAAKVGQAAIASLLITKGAPIDAKQSNGATALHMAANTCRHEVVKVLLEAGAKVNELDAYKGSPLRLAIQGGYSGLPETMEVLISHGADVKEATRLGTTLLHDAVFYQAGIQAVEILIKNGVDINAKNSEDKTALDMAKEKELNDIIELLTSKG